MIRRLFLVLLATGFCLLSSRTDIKAQDRGRPLYKAAGVITDHDSGEPVYMVSVIVKELGLWTVSDEKGRFEINRLPAGKYTFEFSLLGYDTKKFTFDIRKDMPALKIRMQAATLALDEVVVIAEEGGEMTSASKMSVQTIEHIQPSSLKDVLQLLPGNITENPDLTKNNTLTIRSIGSDLANAAGTALILDGASLSNDANLQMLSAGQGINAGNANTASTAGGSVDVRQVSTDNIESIEVIRGIPSVVYGDLTSGAVVVRTKAGVTPWDIRLKADPLLKQISLGKGFSLGKKNGVINVSADYANAFSDPRTPTSAYNRVNFQIGYSNNFRKKVTFNARLRGNYSNATNRSDADLRLDEISTERDKGLRLNVNGRWNIGRPWITSLEYLVTGGISEQYSRQRIFQASAGYTPTTTAMTDQEAPGLFTKPQYYSDVSVTGLPIDASARLTANLFGQYGKITNKVILGAEWKIQGNDGIGKEFDPLCPPSPGTAIAYRERSYKEIPFLNRITGFLEDNIKIPIGPTRLELQAGARINAIYAAGINTSEFLTAEPRTNARYILINKRRGFRHLSLRGGWGISYKMPSMIYLYPEKAYMDQVSFSYNDFDANHFGMNVITTKTAETLNPDLRAQRSENIEAGIEFDSDILKGSVVYFNEKMRDGYGFVTEYLPMVYTRYGYRWENGDPSQIVIPSGKRPVYHNGSVTVNSIPLPSIQDTTFMALSRPVNDITQNKWGIEYTLDFAQIRPIHTSISISGAYMNIRQLNSGSTMRLYSGGSNGRSYPYVGIYAGSSSSSNGSIRERGTANIRFITHIPRIAMVVTLTAQMVFLDRHTALSELNGKSLPYFYDGSGRRVEGEEALRDRTHTKFINPLYLMNRKGETQPFTQQMERLPEFRNLILTTNTASYYIRQSYPLYGLLNIRITKEIKQIATISFYANNFLNIRGRVKNSVTGYASDRNSPIYFGAEVKITIR